MMFVERILSGMAYGAFQASINAIAYIYFFENSGFAFSLIEGIGGIGHGASGPISAIIYETFGFKGPFVAFAFVQFFILCLNFMILDKNEIETVVQ